VPEEAAQRHDDGASRATHGKLVKIADRVQRKDISVQDFINKIFALDANFVNRAYARVQELNKLSQSSASK